MTLISTVGGASGPLYGTFFLRLATAIGDHTVLDPAELGAALRAGLEGVMQRGKATTDDKTMVDADEPGGRRLRRRGRRRGLGRPRSGRDGSGRGTRPDHAAGGPQGQGELPRRAVGQPPGSRRHLDHHPVRIPPRRRRGGADPTHRPRKEGSDRHGQVRPRARPGHNLEPSDPLQRRRHHPHHGKPGVPPDLPVARPRRARSGGDLGLAARRRQEGDRGRGRVARRHRRHRHHQPARDDRRLGQEHRRSRSRTRSSGRAASRPGTATSSRRPATRTSSATRPASRSTPTSAARRSGTSCRTTPARRSGRRRASCCSEPSTASSSGG